MRPNSHTHTHTHCRTPLDERSACRRDLYLTTHNIHRRQTSIPPAGFEPVIPVTEHPQTHASDGASRRKENPLPQKFRQTRNLRRSCTVLKHRLSYVERIRLQHRHTAPNLHMFSENVFLQSKSSNGHFLLRSSIGHGTVHVVSRRLLSTDDDVRFPAIACGIYRR